MQEIAHEERGRQAHATEFLKAPHRTGATSHLACPHPFSVAGTAASASTQCSAEHRQPCRPVVKRSGAQIDQVGRSVGSYTAIGPCVMVALAGEHQRAKRRKRSMGLTLEEANRILRGALAKAQELNIKISAAVCDAGGRLVAFQRMDNAIWANAYASQGKAAASAAFGPPRGGGAGAARHTTPG